MVVPYQPTSQKPNDDEKYAQREALIRQILESANLMPTLEACAAKRGFTESAGAVTYVIGEIARDETTYRAAIDGAYEPNEFSLLTDIYLSKLQQSVAKRAGPGGDSQHRR
jgi:hypothetical protein